MNWLCNHIQTAIFLADEKKHDGRSLWTAMGLPEAGMYFKEGMSNPMGYPGEVFGAPYLGYSVILGVQNSRIDLWVTPAGEEQNKTPNFPYLKDVDIALNMLNEKADSIFDKVSCNRIGMVAEMGILCDDQNMATNLFLRKINSSDVIPENSRDLLFKYTQVENEKCGDYFFDLNNAVIMKTFLSHSVNFEIDMKAGTTNKVASDNFWGVSRNVDFNTVKKVNVIEKNIVKEIVNVISKKILSAIKG